MESSTCCKVTVDVLDWKYIFLDHGRQKLTVPFNCNSPIWRLSTEIPNLCLYSLKLHYENCNQIIVGVLIYRDLALISSRVQTVTKYWSQKFLESSRLLQTLLISDKCYKFRIPVMLPHFVNHRDQTYEKWTGGRKTFHRSARASLFPLLLVLRLFSDSSSLTSRRYHSFLVVYTAWCQIWVRKLYCEVLISCLNDHWLLKKYKISASAAFISIFDAILLFIDALIKSSLLDETILSWAKTAPNHSISLT